MIDRRTFIGAVTSALLAAPLAAVAQQRGKVARIGYLRRTSPQPADIAALSQGLQELARFSASEASVAFDGGARI